MLRIGIRRFFTRSEGLEEDNGSVGIEDGKME